jgi:SAM-dependent methyltransferase
MGTPRLYDELVWLWPFVSPPEHYPEEVATFRRRFQAHHVADGARVLHLGSGGGSIDCHLKQHYQVTGVDRSPAMIGHARAINPEVEYREGDLRSVRLGRRFAAVLLHDASAYLTTPADLRAAYETAAAHLEPGGVMVTLPEELRSRFQQHRSQVDTETRGGVSVTVLEVDYDPDPTDHVFEKTFVFLIRQDGRLQVEVDTHRMGLYHLEEMLSLMRDAGFDPAAEPWELSDLPPGVDYPLVTAVLRRPG